MFFDTHVHFDSFVKDGSFAEILQQAFNANVHEMLAVGGSKEANTLSLQLATDHPGQILGCVGYDRDEATADIDFDELRVQLADPLVKAVGETGLDYYYKADTARAQQKLFEKNLELAVEFEKPVVVHTRDADDDTLALLRNFATAWHGAPDLLGVLHCFTRDKSFAKQILDLGLMISFSGIVTFANADPLRQVAAYVPWDRLLIETDAPYLAPIPHRGNRNCPAFVVHTAKQLAEIRACPLEFLAKQTLTNARTLFAP